MIFIAAVADSSTLDAILRPVLCKYLLKTHYVSSPPPYTHFTFAAMSAMFPNAGRIRYFHVVFQIPFLLLANANNYSFLITNIWKTLLCRCNSSLPNLITFNYCLILLLAYYLIFFQQYPTMNLIILCCIHQ